MSADPTTPNTEQVERRCVRCGVLASEAAKQAEPICSDRGLVTGHSYRDFPIATSSPRTRKTQMSDPTTPKTRIITLTDRPPVRIREDEWPEVAGATGDSWDGPFDPARHNQALMRGEVDRYSLRVRQHNDGRRTLVYGVVTAGIAPRGQGHDRRGGELLVGIDAAATATAIVRAIRRVGAELEIPDRIIRECIADMPPEEL